MIDIELIKIIVFVFWVLSLIAIILFLKGAKRERIPCDDCVAYWEMGDCTDGCEHYHAWLNGLGEEKREE